MTVLQANLGAAVASANNLTLGLDGNVYKITGTTQINRISAAGWQEGSEIMLVFAGAVRVKNNQSASGAFLPMKLLRGVDFVTQADDTLTLVHVDGFWHEKARKSFT